MADVTLTASVRDSLLSLQGTTNLIERTQGRMSSGLKVAGPIDDPVAYFQAKGLNDRASDFNEKKDAIDQGISSLTTALDGISSVESLVNQLKGIANSLKSAESSQVANLITQFNDLRDQINFLTTDATYQGTNLINGTGQTLSVEFSNEATSKVSVSSVNLTNSGLGVVDLAQTSGLGATTLAFNQGAMSANTLSRGETVTLTYGGAAARTLAVTASTSYTITYGTASLTLNVSAGGTVVLGANTAYTFTVGYSSTASGATSSSDTTLRVGLFSTAAGASATKSLAAYDGRAYASAGGTTQMNAVIDTLDAAKTTLRTNASTLGTNVALLKTRLDFTETYSNTLTSGASKLTLADINEEGANLLALQTRQQLGINALSLAGQAEQSVLSLFR